MRSRRLVVALVLTLSAGVAVFSSPGGMASARPPKQIAAGVAGKRVPNVVGKRLDRAVTTLEADGFAHHILVAAVGSSNLLKNLPAYYSAFTVCSSVPAPGKLPTPPLYVVKLNARRSCG